LGRDGKTGKDRPGRRLFLRGVKQAMKGIHYQDGEKLMEWELTDVKYFNRFDEQVFAKP
jgi:hypothetical protein